MPSDGPGTRWRPPTYSLTDGDQTELPWGLIAGKEELGGGMVQHEIASANGVVGYTHGMVQAIYEAVGHGPWCTPFEIAFGDQTDKLASCLTCSLFMYAAGYPPSSVHLGRGESWCPMYPRNPGDDGYSPAIDEAIRSTNTRWYIECAQHLELGVEILSTAKIAKGAHQERLRVFQQFLEGDERDFYSGANLILDAVTVHSGEADRIDRALL